MSFEVFADELGEMEAQARVVTVIQELSQAGTLRADEEKACGLPAGPRAERTGC